MTPPALHSLIPPRTGYFTASYVSSIDDSEQPFALWAPRSYSPRKKYPLIVALHGTDADHRMIPEDCFRIHQRGFREDAIFLSVFGRGDLFYRWPGEADLWDSIGWVRKHYSIDTRRQYLTGLSMGGFSAWWLGCRYPEQWAAIAPVCGFCDVHLLKHLQHVPVWCVHGQKDDLVPVENSRRLINELKRLRHSYRYDELEGWGHNSWEWLYDPDRNHDSLADWFLQHRKEKAPPPVKAPRREEKFKDLFSERLIISYPSRTPIPRETALLREEAEKLARFTSGDFIMRSGRLIVKPDAELTEADLRQASHLMLGRSDNHLWLKKKERLLWARHHRGLLQVKGETYLGKSLLALTCQPSPWNKKRLLGIIAYQQVRQARGIAERLCSYNTQPETVNVYDPLQNRFIRQESPLGGIGLKMEI